MGSLIPMFWTSGDISSGFQSHNGQPYSHLAETCGVTPTDLLMASMAAGRFPNMPNLRNFKGYVNKWYFCEFVAIYGKIMEMSVIF